MRKMQKMQSPTSALGRFTARTALCLFAALALPAACSRISSHPADADMIPRGTGWFESALELGVCARTCQTRPCAMTADGKAPVPECGHVDSAWCVTYQGPENAGGPVRCWCQKERCRRERAALLRADFGAPLRNVSDCSLMR